MIAARPLDLAVVGMGRFADTLCWRPSLDRDFDHYELWRQRRSVAPWPYRLLASPLRTDTTAIDTTLTPGIDYRYRLIAAGAGGVLLAESMVELTSTRGGGAAVGLAPRVGRLAPGGRGELDLWVDSIAGIFGGVFEIDFDPQKVSIEAVEAGPLLSATPLFLTRVDEGRIALGFSRVAGGPELASSGCLARIDLIGTEAGEARFEAHPPPLLVDSTGSAIAGSDRLIFVGARIQVGAGR